MTDWQAPVDWQRFTTVDAHTAGEPFRVVIDGFPELLGETILERRRHVKDNFDHLRKALMWEPRGHADMYGCLITEPVTAEADLGVIFMHNEGYSTMCGHGIIGLATVALEIGLLPITGPETEIGMDTPAGFVRATAFVEDGRVTKVRFVNVPSFVVALEQKANTPGLGEVLYDLAFGGAYYAYLQADDVELRLEPDDFGNIIERGVQVKRAVMLSQNIANPLEQDLGFLYGTIFISQAKTPGVHSRNVCVFADGEVDRCPTGTGVSGRLAIEHARGNLGLNEWIEIESIIGTRFRGRIIAETVVDELPAVIPEIEGEAYITGRHQFLIDPNDPLKDGFLLR